MQFDFSELPHDLEAERAVVGACFGSRTAIGDAQQVLGSTGEMFYDATMAVLYETIVSLDNTNATLDLPIVLQSLRSQPSAVPQMTMLQIVGGEEAVREALSYTTWPQNASHYGEIIWSHYVRRKMIRSAADIAGMGYDTTSDTHELIARAEQRIYNLRGQHSRFGAISAEQAAHDFWEIFTRQADDPNYNLGWQLGITNIDHIVGHVDPGRLVIIAGRPGFGKTATALWIARDMAMMRGEPTMVAIYEQGINEVMRLFLAQLTGIDSMRLKSPHLLEMEELEACANANAEVAQSPLWFVELGDPIHVTSTAKRVSTEAEHRFGKPLSMLVVDYLGLMPPMPNSRAQTRDQEVGEISRHLKLFSKEQGIVTLLLSQLNREAERRNNHRPMLSDLRESGNIEQDADIVLFVYCPTHYMADAERQRALADFQDGYEPYEHIIAKWRAGRTGTAYNAWQKRTGKIISLATGGVRR